tara:strand:- start:43 stop:843 length:801 start_codon:yes stop_codon:yes gene_type:complete
MIKRKKYKVYPPLLSNNGNNTDNVWLSGPLELNDNDNVLIIDPQEGEQLVYNEVTKQWENKLIPQIKTWLTESHQIGGGAVTSKNTYYGGPIEGFSAYANWNTPQWTLNLLNFSSFDWATERGSLRPIPYSNVTKIYFNGHIGVPPNNHYTNIYIYHYPCLDNVNTSPALTPLIPTCLGVYSTLVNSAGVGSSTGIGCMNFEIDLIDILGYSLGTEDMIMVVVQVINSANPNRKRSVSLSTPMMVNFNLSLETTDPSLEFNTAGAC